jgi:hypothetical protein
VEVVLLIQGKYALLLFFIYKHLNVSKLWLFKILFI